MVSNSQKRICISAVTPLCTPHLPFVAILWCWAVVDVDVAIKLWFFFLAIRGRIWSTCHLFFQPGPLEYLVWITFDQVLIARIILFPCGHPPNIPVYVDQPMCVDHPVDHFNWSFCLVQWSSHKTEDWATGCNLVTVLLGNKWGMIYEQPGIWQLYK